VIEIFTSTMPGFESLKGVWGWLIRQIQIKCLHLRGGQGIIPAGMVDESDVKMVSGIF